MKRSWAVVLAVFPVTALAINGGHLNSTSDIINNEEDEHLCDEEEIFFGSCLTIEDFEDLLSTDDATLDVVWGSRDSGSGITFTEFGEDFFRTVTLSGRQVDAYDRNGYRIENQATTTWAYSGDELVFTTIVENREDGVLVQEPATTLSVGSGYHTECDAEGVCLDYWHDGLVDCEALANTLAEWGGDWCDNWGTYYTKGIPAVLSLYAGGAALASAKGVSHAKNAKDLITGALGTGLFFQSVSGYEICDSFEAGLEPMIESGFNAADGAGDAISGWSAAVDLELCMENACADVECEAFCHVETNVTINDDSTVEYETIYTMMYSGSDCSDADAKACADTTWDESGGSCQ